MPRKPPQRRHGFIGRIYTINNASIGFIRPDEFWRMDGEDPGLDVDDDIFVHINAFELMRAFGYEPPRRLEVDMMVCFFIGPSRNKRGKVTAEFCTIHQEGAE